MMNLARHKTPRNDSKLLAPLPTQRKRGKRQGGISEYSPLTICPWLSSIYSRYAER